MKQDAKEEKCAARERMGLAHEEAVERLRGHRRVHGQDRPAEDTKVLQTQARTS